MAKGKKPRPQLPTEGQTAILRRLARPGGKLIATFVRGEKTYSYEDGVAVGWNDASRLIARGWVSPESPGLIGDEPQSWTVAPLA